VDGPPPFVNVGVVGLGLIGGSLALACRQAWPTSLVIGVDRPEVVEEAIARHAIDVAADDLFILSEADLVVLAAPIEQNLRLR
jgi:prephenate dehydrogenase